MSTLDQFFRLPQSDPDQAIGSAVTIVSASTALYLVLEYLTIDECTYVGVCVVDQEEYADLCLAKYSVNLRAVWKCRISVAV